MPVGCWPGVDIYSFEIPPLPFQSLSTSCQNFCPGLQKDFQCFSIWINTQYLHFSFFLQIITFISWKTGEDIIFTFHILKLTKIFVQTFSKKMSIIWQEIWPAKKLHKFLQNSDSWFCPEIIIKKMSDCLPKDYHKVGVCQKIIINFLRDGVWLVLCQ